MKSSTMQHVEVTLDLAMLPRPASDPKAADLTRRLAAAEDEAQRNVGELAEAKRAEAEAGGLYSTALGDGNEHHAANAAKALEGAAARVAVVRSRLAVVGRLVDDLREKQAQALSAASLVVVSAEWAEARRLLETSREELAAAARRVEGQVLNLDALARDLTAAPRAVLRAVRFVGTFRPDFGQTGGGVLFNPGEVASFLPDEAAAIVAKGAAVYMDPWRGLGDAHA